MSSNIRLKKLCQNCGKIFTAKTTVTKFCSDSCAKANYKKRQKEHKIELSAIETEKQMGQGKLPRQKEVVSSLNAKEMVTIIELSALTRLSERTLFRLMKDPSFPRIKIGKKLLFKSGSVIDYLTSKYGNV